MCIYTILIKILNFENLEYIMYMMKRRVILITLNNN